MIKSILIENFMSIENALIEFDESNIIDLCGYNDSGKSAVIRLIDIMFYNAYQTEQVHFIRTGEDYFRCVMTFTDGVEYERIKKNTGVSIFILRKDGQEIYNNQSGRQIINTGGIPKVISDYLGVVKDDYTKEELNVRRCTDRLFLINTTGGDNYKILNTILQSEALAETSTRLNIDKNKLQNEVVARLNQLSALQAQREDTPVVPSAMLDQLTAETNKLEQMTEQLACLEKAHTAKQTRDSIVITPSVSTVDLDRYVALTSIQGYKAASEVLIQQRVTSVELSRLQELVELSRLQETAAQPIPTGVSTVETEQYCGLADLYTKKELMDSAVVPKAITTVVDINRVTELAGVYSQYCEVLQKEDEYQTKQAAYSEAQSKLKDLADQYDLTICKNCGAVTVGGHTHE